MYTRTHYTHSGNDVNRKTTQSVKIPQLNRYSIRSQFYLRQIDILTMCVCFSLFVCVIINDMQFKIINKKKSDLNIAYLL